MLLNQFRIICKEKKMRSHSSGSKETIKNRNDMHKRPIGTMQRCVVQKNCHAEVHNTVPHSPTIRSHKHKASGYRNAATERTCDKVKDLRVENNGRPRQCIREHYNAVDNLNFQLENLTVENHAGSSVDATAKFVCEAKCSNNHGPEDVSVDELASYFENFVYIPRKMSPMAEMMYT